MSLPPAAPGRLVLPRPQPSAIWAVRPKIRGGYHRQGPGAGVQKVLLRPIFGLECELDPASVREAALGPVRWLADEVDLCFGASAQLEPPLDVTSSPTLHQAASGSFSPPDSTHVANPGAGATPPATTFVDSLRLPLDDPILRTPPRATTTSVLDDDWVPRRSTRLAAKAPFRDPQPERQAKLVLISKWSSDPAASAPRTDAPVDAKFREAFALPLSPSKRTVMSHFYPARGGRGRRGGRTSRPTGLGQ